MKRLRRVPGMGPKDADIMIVGEAPGEQEALTGKPFMGAAGRRLNKWLGTAGILRNRCYITNVVKVRPPANKYDRLEELGVSEADFIPELVEEIKEVQPKVIVALGNNAMRVLTGNESGIMKRRGSFYPLTLVPDIDIPVLVTLHPAARIFSTRPELSSICAFDLKRAKNRVNGELEQNQCEYIFRPGPSDVAEFLQSRYDKPTVVDIEFIHGRVTCIGVGDAHVAMVIPITHTDGKPYWNEEDELNIWEEFQKFWDVSPIIGQNFSFDMTKLFNWVGLPKNFYFDTLVAHAVLYPTWKHDLALLTSIYTNMPYYKDEVKDWKGRITDESLWGYNAKDIEATYLVYEGLLEELEEEGMREFYFGHVHPEILVYLEMGLRGVRVDTEKKKKLAQEMKEKIIEAEHLLEELVGRSVNVGSPKQVSDLLYKQLKIKGKGTDKRQLKKLAARYADTSIGPIIQLVNKIRQMRKLLSSYLEPPTSPDGRWRTSYSVTGAISGRLSARKFADGSGLNMQTVPPEVRPLIIADEGMTLAESDLSQAEARVVAWEADDPKMKQFFLEGGDVHQRVADAMGVTRKLAKGVSHGSNYGLGVNLLSEMIGLPVKQARELQNAYFMQFPGVKRRMRKIDSAVRQRKPYYNPFGRRMTYWGFINHDTLKSAYSFFPQGTVADIIHRAARKLRKEYPWIILLLNNHDSLVYEAPKERIKEAAEIVEKYLQEPVVINGEELSIPADTEIFEEHWEKR